MNKFFCQHKRETNYKNNIHETKPLKPTEAYVQSETY